MIKCITNSKNMHIIMLNSGVIWKVKDKYPYYLYNEELNIAFLPSREDIPENIVMIVDSKISDIVE